MADPNRSSPTLHVYNVNCVVSLPPGGYIPQTWGVPGTCTAYPTLAHTPVAPPLLTSTYNKQNRDIKDLLYSRRIITIPL